MRLRLLWTANPPRSPFEWTPETVSHARLALQVVADLEAFIDQEPMPGKVTASWGGVEAQTGHGWRDIEEVVADWQEPELGTRAVLGSEAAVETAREVASAYLRYLVDEQIVTSGRVGLVNRYIDDRTPRSG